MVKNEMGIGLVWLFVLVVAANGNNCANVKIKVGVFDVGTVLFVQWTISTLLLRVPTWSDVEKWEWSIEQMVGYQSTDVSA